MHISSVSSILTNTSTTTNTNIEMFDTKEGAWHTLKHHTLLKHTVETQSNAPPMQCSS